MKLYYAFSNTMVLTQANIQANVSKEEGDSILFTHTVGREQLPEGKR